MIPRGGPMGSSPDSISGPILPNRYFPIQISFIATRDAFEPAATDVWKFSATDTTGSGWEVSLTFTVH